MRIHNQLSEPFTVERGVKQGSILFYLIPDCDGSTSNAAKREKIPGLSVCQTYVGAAIHADDLRTTAESKDAVSQQAYVICNFAETANLKLNASKLEL